MKNVTLELEVKFHWWFKPYLHVLAFVCMLFDLEPDWEKLQSKIKTGTRITGK